MRSRHLTELRDTRLVARGNRIMDDLFRAGCQSIRRFCRSEAEAKGCYRFLRNKRISEADIISNLQANCRAAAAGKYLVCIQDTTQIDLYAHKGRIQSGDSSLGAMNNKGNKAYGFLLHPCLVIDAIEAIPYGYGAIKVWNRDQEPAGSDLAYRRLPVEERESYRWTEVSLSTKKALADIAKGLVMVQDREGDIYQQYATIPDQKTALLVRAKANRVLSDGTSLSDATRDMAPAGTYVIEVGARDRRKARKATVEIRYRQVEICRPRWHQSTSHSDTLAPTVHLYLIEAKETGYNGKDAICWRLLTTLDVPDLRTAQLCIEWYSWRWTIEEVFRVLKKEGFNVEATELEKGSSVRKMSLMILETIIKLFLMRLAYAEPEVDLSADSCFSEEEQQFLEHQITYLEGKTQRQKNPYRKGLKRYVWTIARLGGWKGYESNRHPGITTLWIGLQQFYAAMQGWIIHRDVSTR